MICFFRLAGYLFGKTSKFVAAFVGGTILVVQVHNIDHFFYLSRQLVLRLPRLSENQQEEIERGSEPSEGPIDGCARRFRQQEHQSRFAHSRAIAIGHPQAGQWRCMYHKIK